MDFEIVFKTVLFSGIIGFAVFCASYAFHVWRSRNSAAGRTRPSLLARARGWTALLALTGVVLLLGAGVWREVMPREGILSGDQVFTIRAEANLRPEYIAQAGAVKAGDVLARFRSPERNAEVAELNLKLQILEAQKRITERQPVSPDPELIRLVQALQNDRRQLQASIRYLLPEEATVTREKTRDRLDRTERLNALGTKAEDTRREITRVTAELEKARRYESRARNLATSSAAAPLEFDDRATEATVLQAELSGLESHAVNLQREIEHLESGLPEFAACAGVQAVTLGTEIAATRRELEGVERELETAQKRLAADLRRAEELRQQQIEQLDLQLRQCRAKLAGLQDVLTIKAPSDGLIAFSDSAPQMALPLSPVAVLAPLDGFRFRVRLPKSEIEHLERAGEVPLKLRDPLLYRRFSGRLLNWHELPFESQHVLAELACMPPSETIRELASRDWVAQGSRQTGEVWCRLMWRPPLRVVPLFWPAIVMLGMGIAGLAAIRGASSARGPLRPQPVPPQAPTSPAVVHSDLLQPLAGIQELPNGPITAGHRLDGGAVARNLELLGSRLREAIRRRDIDNSLLSAAEWALDRHHVRAIKHLGNGLDHDPELPAQLRRLVKDLRASHPEPAPEGGGSCGDRLIRILRTVAPALLSDCELGDATVCAEQPEDASPQAQRRSQSGGKTVNA